MGTSNHDIIGVKLHNGIVCLETMVSVTYHNVTLHAKFMIHAATTLVVVLSMPKYAVGILQYN